MHSVTRCWRRGSALAVRSAGGASKRPPCGCSRRLASAATDQQAELFAVAHEIPPSHIRNFCIISHVDHGKSTLADRLMDMTGAVPSGKSRAQLLDSLEVERSRGITVKAQTVSLFHRDEASGELYLLNLIDTPGHVDFSYEVSRSIAACQGALLLVDCTKGVQVRTAAAAITQRLAGRTAPTHYTRSFLSLSQAQTVANFWLAFEQDLAILPIVNKVDLGHADVQGALAQMATAFDTDADEALQISAKTGLGTARMWQAVLLAPQRTALASRGCPPRGRLLRCCAMHSGRATGPINMRPPPPPSLHRPCASTAQARLRCCHVC